MRDLLIGFLLLVGLQLLGEVLVRVSGVPVPGAVVGMLLLLLLLVVLGERFLERIARAADVLLRNLSLFFFGPVVALVLDRALFAAWAMPLALAVFVGTPLAMLILGLLLKATTGTKEGGQEDAG